MGILSINHKTLYLMTFLMQINLFNFKNQSKNCTFQFSILGYLFQLWLKNVSANTVAYICKDGNLWNAAYRVSRFYGFRFQGFRSLRDTSLRQTLLNVSNEGYVLKITSINGYFYNRTLLLPRRMFFLKGSLAHRKAALPWIGEKIYSYDQV